MNCRTILRNLLDGMVRDCPYIGLDRRAEKFVQLFENHIPAASEILDIGGGWGFYEEPLRLRGHKVTVLDVVKPGFQKAPVVVYENGRFPFKDKSFDVSLLITVLHHTRAPDAIIREAHRVTRYCVIVVEDLYHHTAGRWWTVLRDCIYNLEFFGHPCNFKKKGEWKALFKRLGFSLAEAKEIYTWLCGLRILNGIFVFRVL
ncbi:MAG: methyltransferase domain-containing protein [Candidatus Omnitrophica bacterium]|nr:methyltransferase domain-containing protein [Candidatus Omnitrophota bacterium]